jgi:hypothetical protein
MRSRHETGKPEVVASGILPFGLSAFRSRKSVRILPRIHQFFEKESRAASQTEQHGSEVAPGSLALRSKRKRSGFNGLSAMCVILPRKRSARGP